jgi:beta-lysine 5,6-aminomutase alpha subunit
LKLDIQDQRVEACRSHAQAIAQHIQPLLDELSTVSVERTIARLIGIDGVDSAAVPLPNILVDELQASGMLKDGIYNALGNAVLSFSLTAQEFAESLGRGEIQFSDIQQHDQESIDRVMEPYLQRAMEGLDEVRDERKQLQLKYPCGRKPWLYVIVATGNIYEDRIQAKAAAKQGADIVAVIRTTAQSLLDYVPYGSNDRGIRRNLRYPGKFQDHARCTG